MPTTSVKNRLSTSHTDKAMIALVAARRMSTEHSSANASQKPMYSSDSSHHTIRRMTSSAVGTMPSWMTPIAPTMHHDHGQDEADRGQAGDELAVDHVVAIDGLGEQARQRRFRALAVDRVKAEGNAQQRDRGTGSGR